MIIQNYPVPQEVQDKMRDMVVMGPFVAKDIEKEILNMGVPKDVAFRVVDSALAKFKREKLIEFGKDRKWHVVKKLPD